MKRPKDSSLLGGSVAEDPICERMDRSPLPPGREKNPAAVALSMLGASKGGHARAASLSARKRTMIARMAAKARWAQKPE